MISYEPFWNMLKDRGESWYSLEHKYKISTAELSRLKNNMNITTETVNFLCETFDCTIPDIMVFIKSSNAENNHSKEPK